VLRRAEPFAAAYPEVAAEWHPTRNGSLRSGDFSAGSKVRIWWRCSADVEHGWATSIGNRTSKRSGCPICAGQRVSRHTSLAYVRQDLAAEWHPDRNGALTPDSVTVASGLPVWWKCQRNAAHEWQAPPGRRSSGNGGCPFCSGRRVSSEVSLLTRPDVLREWDAIRNGDLDPADLSVTSHRKVWWLCPIDPAHSWEAMVDNRIRHSSGCPYCSGRRSTMSASLQARSPELALQWNHQKNGELEPDQISTAASKRVWWICPVASDHEWTESVPSRLRGRGCPYCRGAKRSSTSSLSAANPSLAAQWCMEKNPTLTPDMVTPSSLAKVWWRCPAAADHLWLAGISVRARGQGCPYCGGALASSTSSLAARRPDLAAEWHSDRNGDVRPETVTLNSTQRVWWKCRSNPHHEWQVSINNRKPLDVRTVHAASSRNPSRSQLCVLHSQQSCTRPRMEESRPTQFLQHPGRRSGGNVEWQGSTFGKPPLSLEIKGVLAALIAARSVSRSGRSWSRSGMLNGTPQLPLISCRSGQASSTGGIAPRVRTTCGRRVFPIVHMVAVAHSVPESGGRLQTPLRPFSQRSLPNGMAR
jgi:hypothetical protein